MKDCKAPLVVIQRNPCKFRTPKKVKGKTFKICTWNVRTLFEAGKAHNAIREMQRLSIDIMGISEMRWPGTGQCQVEEHTIYYSGNNENKHENGVGIIVSKEMNQFIENFVPVNERMLLVTLSTTPVKCNVVQVYAPTAEKAEEQIESFYRELEDLVKKLPKQNINIIMGDYNAKIGQGKSGELVGDYGLGDRNERGDRLLIFAQEHQLAIMNTFFKLPARRLYTWVSPQDKPGNVVRNQIDYLLINKRFRNSIQSAKTYPSADIGSDHNALVAKINVRLKRLEKNKRKQQYDMTKLKDNNIKTQVAATLKRGIANIDTSNNIEVKLEEFRATVEEIHREHLKPSKPKKHQWMTDEILYMMDERRRYKGTNIEKYREIQRNIRKEIRVAKEKWLEEQCKEIEELERKHDHFNMHRKTKEAAGMVKRKTVGRMIDEEGNIIIEKEAKIEKWKDYITKLFDDEQRGDPKQITCVTGPYITEDEVRVTISLMKDGKMAGPDGIQSEILKLLDDDAITWITSIFNQIYDSGKIPREWLKSTFIAIPKKPSAKYCTDYRTISIMSHLLKIFLKIIHRRIYRLCEEQLSETQFGFRNALGTREALFAVQVMFQRCRDVNVDIYACFIDYHKAFDRVKHDKLINVLEKIGIDDKDLQIIINLYWNQSAYITIDGDNSEEIEIRRGVRQGCVLSPLLFNIYSEQIFNESLQDIEAGILLNGTRMNNIRYADDAIIFADGFEGLKELVSKIEMVSRRYGLEMNIQKTKYMVISKNTIPPEPLIVNSQPIERVTSITYLGTSINSQWDHAKEIKSRIEKARTTFVNMQKVFKSRDLNLNTKIRLLRCYVFSVLLYGAEAWTLTEATMKKLEAFEMWTYRRILRISWVDHVTNVEVLLRMNKTTEIVKTIKIRKLQYFGHIMRNEQRYGILQRILQGKVLGKRGPGRRRISWLKNLRSWFSMTTTDLFRTAVNKVRIAILIANIRNG